MTSRLLQAAGVLVHINDRTDDPAHRWKPCYKACNHGQYWASMPTASRYLFYLSIPDDRVAGTVSCIFASPSLPGLQLLGDPFGAQRVGCPCFFCIPKLAWLAISLTSFIGSSHIVSRCHDHQWPQPLPSHRVDLRNTAAADRIRALRPKKQL